MKIGDRIKFKALTRWSNRAVWRKIVGFDSHGRPEVRFGGWSSFVVAKHEILEVEAA